MIGPYTQGDELPAWSVYFPVDDDMSNGWTFTVRVAARGSTTALFEKTTGITGGDGATEPHASVVWATSGELNSLSLTGITTFDVSCTARNSSSQDITIHDQIVVRPAITSP